MENNSFYTLTMASQIIGCSIEELMKICFEHELGVGVAAEYNWYFWKNENGFVYPPIKNPGFVELDDAGLAELKDILQVGYCKVDLAYDGYLSGNPRLKYGGVIIEKQHLAISESIFIELTEPSKTESIQNQQPKSIIKNGNVNVNEDHISQKLSILNNAAYQWWSSVDKDNKATYPTNKQVSDWLEKQGFSQINAQQGAVIIRPEWAGLGRPPKE